MTAYGLDGPALWEAVDKVRKREGWTWKQIAEWVGCCPHTLQRLRRGSGTNADTLICLLLWLGTTRVDGRFIWGVEFVTEQKG